MSLDDLKIEGIEIYPENETYFEPFRDKEVVVSAACLFELDFPDGTYRKVVLPMVRHYSPDAHVHLSTWKLAGIKFKEIEQGFVTNQYRFLDREQALKLAKAQNQLGKREIVSDVKLFSEMLY